MLDGWGAGAAVEQLLAWFERRRGEVRGGGAAAYVDRLGRGGGPGVPRPAGGAAAVAKGCDEGCGGREGRGLWVMLESLIIKEIEISAILFETDIFKINI